MKKICYWTIILFTLPMNIHALFTNQNRRIAPHSFTTNQESRNKINLIGPITFVGSGAICLAISASMDWVNRFPTRVALSTLAISSFLGYLLHWNKKRNHATAPNEKPSFFDSLKKFWRKKIHPKAISTADMEKRLPQKAVSHKSSLGADSFTNIEALADSKRDQNVTESDITDFHYLTEEKQAHIVKVEESLCSLRATILIYNTIQQEKDRINISDLTTITTLISNSLVSEENALNKLTASIKPILDQITTSLTKAGDPSKARQKALVLNKVTDCQQALKTAQDINSSFKK